MTDTHTPNVWLPDAWMFNFDALAISTEDGFTLNPEVYEIVWSVWGSAFGENRPYIIVFCTSHGHEQEDFIGDWLDSKNIPYDDLLCRQPGDDRSDNEMKVSMYVGVRDTYCVRGVFEGRCDPAAPWPGLGITQFTVCPGA